MAKADYPPIGDYALIGDCHTVALVSSAGSIDWCCLPRADSGSTFGRILDWERGGCFELAPVRPDSPGLRDYADDTLVLTSGVRGEGGEALVTDCLLGPPGTERTDERRHILRVVEGRRGAMEFTARIAPRFDFGQLHPWIRHHGRNTYSATGGDDGLLVWSDAELEAGDGELTARFSVRAGERIRLSVMFLRPEDIDDGDWEHPEPEELDKSLERTLRWWREWSGTLRIEGEDAPGLERSALVLKALAYAPTGAIAAAPTTSLPESLEGRTWDYRYSWIRDAALTSRSLARLGCEAEADAFRRFVERSAAGRAEDLRILYGIGGEQRLQEAEVDSLEGWRGIGPVRSGNDATTQVQLDACGHLVLQSWDWHGRGHSPDDYYWRFLVALVESVLERWRQPDAGIWEWRGEPKHFVHSKAMCWAAVDRGLALAKDCMRKAPERRWKAARDEIRDAIASRGYDEERGVFVQAFGERDLDAALLRLPTTGVIDWTDERMVRTTDAIREELDWGGLLRRYSIDDGLPGREGAFLACSFWLVTALAQQDRAEEAREVYDRAMATANGLGLFAEEYDPDAAEMLGNFPQALTHLSHIEAGLALGEQTADRAGASAVSGG
ncbi:MAG: glycoside hydrolase family 15 protein [Thermoleophilaceae bacterium]